MGEEEVHHNIPLMVDNVTIATEMREQVSKGRIEIMKELGKIYLYRRSVQERRNSSALAMELRLSCAGPSIWMFQYKIV